MSIPALQAAITQLQQYTLMDQQEVFSTLLVYVQNLRRFPEEAKYRRIKVPNIHFQERVGRLEGGVAALRAVGFELEGDYLVLLEVGGDLVESASRLSLGGGAPATDGTTSASGAASSSAANNNNNNNNNSGGSGVNSNNGSVRSLSLSLGSATAVPPPKLTEAALETLAECERLLEAARRAAQEEWAQLPRRLDKSHEYSSVMAVGWGDDIGKRPTMEDDEIAVDRFCGEAKCGFFGLYDGHGGRQTVEFVVRALHTSMEHVLRENPTMTPLEAFEPAYLDTDGHVRRQNILQSGSTAVTCVVRREKDNRRVLYVANVGDSRAVLSRGGHAIRLTIDHKPSLPEEEKRIVDAGGFIGRFNRVNGVLAISRALGDHMLKHGEVVTARPYKQAIDLVPGQDDYLLLACDGVWDVMSDQEAIDFVRNYVRPHEHLIPEEPLAFNAVLNEACHALVKESIAKRSLDNVSAMLIRL